MFNNSYLEQVKLLLEIMPIVARQSCFALKGGTAINLFLSHKIPRLSVDIDLTYLPIQTRGKSLEGISQALLNISKDITKDLKGRYPKIKIRSDRPNSDASKLFVSTEKALVKIEPNLIIRGELFPSENRMVSDAVVKEYGLQFEAKVMSIPDVYGGKICAALDRQHPRDLFDVKEMFNKYGLTDQIRSAFVVYLAGHGRPIQELLRPRLQDIRKLFDAQFKGMTEENVTCEELEEVREKLISKINMELSLEERNFLLSIKMGKPNWNLIKINGIEKLPAIQWKLANISKMDKKKHAALLESLRAVLGL